jgi:OOP family OmpA-OmpF porin
MHRRASPDFRRLGLVSALIAVIPGALLAQDRPSAVLPPPSLYDVAPPPGAPVEAVTAPRAAPAPTAAPVAAPAPAATTPAPAPTPVAAAPAPRPATPAQTSAAAEPTQPWYRRMWGTMTGWFSPNPAPAQRDSTMVAAAPSSTSTPVTLSAPRASVTVPGAGYAQDAPERTIRTGVLGECVKTGMWTPSDMVTGCGAGQTVAKVEETAAMPAPVPAEPRVEAVEVQPLPVPTLREEKSLEVEPAAAPPQPEPEPVAMPEPPKPQMTTLSADALFALGSHELKPTAKAALDEFSSKLGSMDFERIKIVGHTDPTGKAALNDRLSRQRAESVKRYLVARGIPADKIETEGVGSSMPMVIETDCAKLPRAQKAACYQPDRRVEIEVQGATSSVAAQ